MRWAILTTSLVLVSSAAGATASDPKNGRIVATARTPYGSFNLSTVGNAVVTTSLLSGQMTEFDASLRRLHTIRPARAARAVALTVWSAKSG
jgi:hypothetical protein